MKLSDFDFELPSDLIAQTPTKNRTQSRLLVAQSKIIDSFFCNIGDFIKPGDLLVMNDTKVIPARIFAHKKSGGKVEIMLERMLAKNQILAMIRSSKSPKIGSILILENQDEVQVLAKNQRFYTLQFSTQNLPKLLAKIGHIPLPPYIKRPDNKADLSRYQTVYAKNNGAVAAPTAGLHFEHKLLKQLKNQGIDQTFITLHIGAGTFLPVATENIKSHKMHSEYLTISQKTVDKIHQTKQRGGRIIAVGTTVVRSLESATKNGILTPTSGETDIFIYPGFKFQTTDMLITNFHLPKSSLLMLVAAFISHPKMQEIYHHAIQKKYRFFSYGDAMMLSKSQL